MSGKSLKSLAGQTAIYGISSIVGKCLNYLLTPLYTYKISAASGGYGIVTNLYSYAALLLVILTFGMETTFFYFVNKKNTDPNKAFSTSLIAVGTVALLFVAAVTVFLTPISSALNYENHPEFIEIMAITVSIDAFQAILFAYLRYKGRSIKFVSLKLLFIVCSILMNLFVFLLAPVVYESHPALMSWYNPSYQIGYIFIINLICAIGITFFFIPELKSLRFGLDFKILGNMLGYTWPLLLFGIMGILNQVGDKIIFRFLVPKQVADIQLGIYGACTKIAMIMTMLTQAFRYAYEPFIFGEKNNAENRQTQANIMKYFVIFALLAFLAVAFYLDILKHIIVIDSGYWEGLKVVPIVMTAEIFMGIYFNLSFWYKRDGDKGGQPQTWWGAVFSGIGCALLLAVNFVFVPRYGYMACAWGGFVGYGVPMALSYLVGQKKAPVPYNVKEIASYFVLAMGLYIFSLLIKPENEALAYVFNTILFLIYIGVLAYREKELFMDILKGLKRIIKK